MMDFINENLILVSLTIFVFLLAIFNELKIKEGNICGLSPVQAVKLINQNAVIFDLRNESDFEKNICWTHRTSRLRMFKKKRVL